MSCPLWGDSSNWGDGDLWCRPFGIGHYHTENTDVVLHWVSTSVTYASAAAFSIHSIILNVDWGRSQQDYTYEAFIDTDHARRPSIQVAYSYAALFRIKQITPHIRIKKKQPQG